MSKLAEQYARTGTNVLLLYRSDQVNVFDNRVGFSRHTTYMLAAAASPVGQLV